MTAKMPSTTTSRMMPETTARVVEMPTALAPVPRLQPAQAADAGDQQREHRRLDHAAQQVLDVDDAVDLACK